MSLLKLQRVDGKKRYADDIVKAAQKVNIQEQRMDQTSSEYTCECSIEKVPTISAADPDIYYSPIEAPTSWRPRLNGHLSEIAWPTKKAPQGADISDSTQT